MFFRKMIAVLALFIPSFAFAQTQICYDVGKGHVALWEDFWQPGMYPGGGYYQSSLCPSWAGRLPGSATNNGRPACYVTAPIPAMNQTYTGYGYCRQQENVFTQECLNGEACLEAMKYAQGGLGSVCNPLVNEAIRTWNLPTAIDCNNMNRKWKDSYGGTWYINQPNRSTQITGWLDTSTSYATQAKCGWWQITGTQGKTGYTYIDAKLYGTKPRKTCLTAMIYSGTTTADKTSGSYRNGLGQVGVFEIYSSEPPPGFTWINWTPVQPSVYYTTLPHPWSTQ